MAEILTKETQKLKELQKNLKAQIASSNLHLEENARGEREIKQRVRKLWEEETKLNKDIEKFENDKSLLATDLIDKLLEKKALKDEIKELGKQKLSQTKHLVLIQKDIDNREKQIWEAKDKSNRIKQEALKIIEDSISNLSKVSDTLK
jgi:hypothetical protein